MVYLFLAVDGLIFKVPGRFIYYRPWIVYLSSLMILLLKTLDGIFIIDSACFIYYNSGMAYLLYFIE